MKAMIWTKYGSPDGLQPREVEKPTPMDNEVLIRVHAATVTAGDCELRSFKFSICRWLPIRLWLGLRKPRKEILGQELAGEVEAVGKDVKSFKEGD
jgi:NADPH:quinone reductase-like Zn-dependent oxidoreductase